MNITSRQNRSLKNWIKLKQKKHRDQMGLFLVYGPHLILEAKKHDAIVEILTSNPEHEGILLSKELMMELQQAETFFEDLAVCKKTNPKRQSTKILMLDDVQDPDNVGALIRSAVAFGFNHIIVSPKSADFYNEKTIRASKGALFEAYLERCPLDSSISELKTQDYQIIYADAHQKGFSNQSKKVVLILGNEGHGVSEEVKTLADASVTIETQNVESLNVSVAGGILMYEWRHL